MEDDKYKSERTIESFEVLRAWDHEGNEINDVSELNMAWMLSCQGVKADVIIGYTDGTVFKYEGLEATRASEDECYADNDVVVETQSIEYTRRFIPEFKPESGS